MSVAPHEMVPPVVKKVWQDLATEGYALISDADLDIDHAFRKHLVYTYFDGGVVQGNGCDVPADRERARDVLRYEWKDWDLRLSEYSTIALVNRGEQPGVRNYPRFLATHDAKFVDWIHAALRLVPPTKRRARGTVGLNLLRTHTQVVTKPHHDDEEFIFIYVVDRSGDGAESTLIDAQSQELVFHQQLQPGQMLVFRDAKFLHNVSPLIPAAAGDTRRDALVCTVDYPTSYPV